jgi:ribosomal protein S18 acetylase RimI-like enzyme
MTANYEEAARNHLIDLQYIDGVLAALIEMISNTDHLLIENVAVSPAFQRKGLGRMLMAHAEEVAASLGHSKLRLCTNKKMVENICLYSSLGYSIDREEDRGDRIGVHMSKAI